MNNSCRLVYVLFFVFFCSVFSADAQRTKFRILDYSENEPKSEMDSFRKLHIVIAGNIYKTEAQIKEAYNPKTKRYDFSHELRNINPILNLGDIVLAQLKTSFTGSLISPYSAPDEFALSLKYSGINNVMLANENTAHIDKKGLLRTQRALGVFDVQTSGAFIDNAQRGGYYPRFIERKGFKVAILNYCEPIEKRSSISSDFLINEIDRDLVERDMKIARDQNPDYVIVYLDWGQNFQEYPSLSQEDFAHFLLEQGANIVVGTFPNAIQKIDRRGYYFRKQFKTGLVAYSLGNLLTGSKEERDKKGAILDIEILKNNFTGEVKEGDIGFIPVWNYYDTSPDKSRLYVLPMAAVEKFNLMDSVLSEKEKIKMRKALFDTRSTMGRFCDEIQYNVTDFVVKNVEASAYLTNSPMNNRYNPYDHRKLKPTEAPRPKVQREVTSDTIYRIQFYELAHKIPIDTTYYTHLKGYEVLLENGKYKYLLGPTTDYEKVKEEYVREIHPRYKMALIVLYYDGRRVKEISLPLKQD